MAGQDDMKLPFSFGLRGRLILLLLAVFAALVGLIAWHSYTDRDARLRAVSAKLLADVKLVAARQQTIAARADAVLNDLILRPELRPGAPAAACTAFISALLERQPEFAQAGWARPDGEVACTAAPLSGRVSHADRAWFQAALRSREMVVSEVVKGRIVGKPIIAFAKAMRDEAGRVTGVLFLAMDLEWLRREMAATRLPEGGRVVVMDAKGTIAVRYPDLEGMAGKGAVNLPLLQHIRATGGEGTVEEMGLDGKRRLFAFTKLMDTVAGPMHIWLAVPKAMIEAPARRDALLGFGILLAILVATLGLVVLGGNRLLVRPLLALAQTAARMSDGDFSARSGLPHGGDEIGRLAATLDGTAESIDDREGKLARANRALRVLTAVNRVMLQAHDEQELLREMCRAIVEDGGYHMAWVGRAADDMRVLEMASWGAEADFFTDLAITWDDTPTGGGPIGTALRQDEPVACNDLQTCPGYEPWREQARRHGHAALLAVPLRLNGAGRGVLGVYAAEADAFDAGVTELLVEAAGDLAYGIAARRAEAERISTHDELKRLEYRDALILDSVGEGIVGLDREGRITFVNPAVRRMLQIPAEEAAGLPFHALYHHSRADGMPYPPEECPIEATCRDGTPCQVADELFWREDGTSFPVEYVGMPLRDERGELAGAVVSFRDIGERKAAEENVQLSAQLLDNTADSIFVMDFAGNFVYLNEAAWKSRGYTRDELMAMTLKELDAPEYATEINTRVRELMEKGHAIFESAHRRKDGSVMPVEVSARFLDLGGRKLVLASVRDIGERKQTEHALRDSEERFRVALESMRDAFIVIGGEDEKIVLWNSAAAAMFGYPQEEAIGQRLHQLIVPPRFHAAAYAGLAKFAGSGEGAAVGKTLELAALRKDGTEFPVELSLSAVRIGGRWHAVGIIRDIAERKGDEERLRKLSQVVEQSPESILITNADVEIEYVNEAFVRATGYDREEVIGRNPRFLRSRKTPPEIYTALWQALSSGHFWKGEVQNKRKDGSDDHVEFAIIAPIRAPDGRVTHYAGMLEDITEKKRLGQELDRHREHLEELVESRTEQLTEARKLADAANQAKSAFLANMSHEIRTPMNAIIGLTHLMKRAGTTPEQTERLTKIDAAAQHLLSIINDILDLSKIESGRLRLESTDFHLSAILDNVRSLIAEQARAKELSVEVDGGSVPPGSRATRPACAKPCSTTPATRSNSPSAAPSACAPCCWRNSAANCWCASRCGTRGSASIRTICPACSMPSSRPTFRPHANTAAPASAWPSPGAWRR